MKFRQQYEYASERDVFDTLPADAQDAIRRIVRAEQRISKAARSMGQIMDTTRDREQVRHFYGQLQDAESALDGAMEDFEAFVVPLLPEGMQ